MEKMLVCGLSNGKSFAKKMLEDKNLVELKYKHLFFPDSEHYLRFLGKINGKKIVLVQSMQPQPNNALTELFFVSRTARELGAKKVIGVIPFMAYMRQDKRFNEGECFSAKENAWLLSQCLDKIVTFDAHLHRIKKLSKIFSVNAVNLSATENIAGFIQKNFDKKKSLVVGPDFESSQWAKKIADSIGFKSTILEKKRISSRKVKIRLTDKKTQIQGKQIIIVDDIISTGKTIIAAIKELKKRKASQVNIICVHALFVESALSKIFKAGAKKVFSTNTVLHKSNKIDLSKNAVKEIMKEIT